MCVQTALGGEATGGHGALRRWNIVPRLLVAAGYRIAAVRRGRQAWWVALVMRAGQVFRRCLADYGLVAGAYEMLGLRQQGPPVGQDQGVERGDPHRLRPARPVEHWPADGLFQRGDLLADRRLAVAQPGGSPAERALIGDGGQGGEMTQLGIGCGRRCGCRCSASWLTRQWSRGWPPRRRRSAGTGSSSGITCAGGRRCGRRPTHLRDGSSELNYAVYRDRYQRTPHGWKFTERVYEVRYLDTTPLAGSAPRTAPPAGRR